MKKITYKFLFCFGLMSLACMAKAQNLIPIPSTLTPNSETLVWSTIGNVVAVDSFANEKEHALRILKERAGVTVSPGNGGGVIKLEADPSLSDDEAYTLAITNSGVTIKGKTKAGVFYGLMTMEQLMLGDGKSTTCIQTDGVSVQDAPRTHVREFMVDAARVFIPYEKLKALVPEMARYKLNSLHLHLVDDQGWRIEIKAYPKLTTEGASRVGMDDLQKPISGFYTQEQMKDLVAFADKYHVMIVPEIEMPGHEVAAVHCYPELTCNSTKVAIRTTSGVSNDLLCPGREFTYTFLGNVFKELSQIFPCKYIHLGGDEAGNPALGKWTTCPDCRALKTKLGITDTTRTSNWKLQKYLFDRMIDTLRTKYAKVPMFWYETDFKEIQAGCVTFGWRHGLTQTAINAAKSNNAKIMLCPGEHCYLDYPARSGDMPEVNWGMPVTSLEQTYKLDPAWGNDATFEKNNLFGVAGTMWSECLFAPERISYQAYPRGLALAEAGWSLQANRSFDGFKQRLSVILRDMIRRGVLSFLPSDDLEIQ